MQKEKGKEKKALCAQDTGLEMPDRAVNGIAAMRKCWVGGCAS